MGCVLKIKLINFSDELNVGSEERRKIIFRFLFGFFGKGVKFGKGS